MNGDDFSFLEAAFKGAVGLLFTVGGWLWVRLVNAVAQNGRDIIKTKDDLAEHKLHTSENYAKKIELQPIYDCLKDIQNDVKSLLGRPHPIRKDDQ